MPNFQQTLAASVATIQSLLPLEAQVARAAAMISRCLTDGGKLLSCGNGGSAADAAHLATEFVCRFVHDRRPYPAIAFTDAGSTLTAIANDYHFDETFARQVQAFGKKGDVLVVLTTSGQSRNVVRALETARDLGVESVALLGRDGGAARGLATIDLIVPSDSTARIQEAHKVLIHALCEAVEATLPK